MDFFYVIEVNGFVQSFFQPADFRISVFIHGSIGDRDRLVVHDGSSLQLVCSFQFQYLVSRPRCQVTAFQTCKIWGWPRFGNIVRISVSVSTYCECMIWPRLSHTMTRRTSDITVAANSFSLIIGTRGSFVRISWSGRSLPKLFVAFP